MWRWLLICLPFSSQAAPLLDRELDQAVSAYAQGQYLVAQRILQRYLQQIPNPPYRRDPRVGLARVYREQARYAQALACYTEASTPLTPMMRLERIEMNIALNRLSLASLELRELESQPLDPPMRSLLSALQVETFLAQNLEPLAQQALIRLGDFPPYQGVALLLRAQLRLHACLPAGPSRQSPQEEATVIEQFNQSGRCLLETLVDLKALLQAGIPQDNHPDLFASTPRVGHLPSRYARELPVILDQTLARWQELCQWSRSPPPPVPSRSGDILQAYLNELGDYLGQQTGRYLSQGIELIETAKVSDPLNAGRWTQFLRDLRALSSCRTKVS